MSAASKSTIAGIIGYGLLLAARDATQMPASSARAPPPPPPPTEDVTAAKRHASFGASEVVVQICNA